jgi:hypothetical protein
MTIVLKSGSLNLLKLSRPVQACNGIAVPYGTYVKKNNIAFVAVVLNFYKMSGECVSSRSSKACFEI